MGRPNTENQKSLSLKVLSSKFEIDVSGTICATKASLKPLYDPLSKRTKT